MPSIKSEIRLRQRHFDATPAHTSTGGNDIRRHWGYSSWLVSSSKNLKEASADQTRLSFITHLSIQWDSTLNWFSLMNWFQIATHKRNRFWNEKTYVLIKVKIAVRALSGCSAAQPERTPSQKSHWDKHDFMLWVQIFIEIYPQKNIWSFKIGSIWTWSYQCYIDFLVLLQSFVNS